MSNNTDASRSWFCVLNNPQKLFGDISPDEMVNEAINKWVENHPNRTCAVNYEISDSGTPHMHMVLEDPSKTRFSAVQKLFPTIHIEPTRGNKKQAKDYILKQGKFEEKNHTVVVDAVFYGEITAGQGKRRDIDVIQDLLAQGMNPNEILDMSLSFRKHEALIRKAFFRKRFKETPTIREVIVYWHVGESKTGKSFVYTQLCEKYGKDSVYLVTDYESGGFDTYCGEPILFLDEFRGNMRFQALLNLLDVYPAQIHCRYANITALWNEVHITSVLPPEEVYCHMVDEEMRDKDKIEQLKRRISFVVFHYKLDGEYKTLTVPMSEYSTYGALKSDSELHGFMPWDESDGAPFE